MQKVTNTSIVTPIRFYKEDEIWMCEIEPVKSTAAVADEILLKALNSGTINPEQIGVIECELLVMIMKILAAKPKEGVVDGC